MYIKIASGAMLVENVVWVFSSLGSVCHILFILLLYAELHFKFKWHIEEAAACCRVLSSARRMGPRHYYYYANIYAYVC